MGAGKWPIQGLEGLDDPATACSSSSVSQRGHTTPRRVPSSHNSHHTPWQATETGISVGWQQLTSSPCCPAELLHLQPLTAAVGGGVHAAGPGPGQQRHPGQCRQQLQVRGNVNSAANSWQKAHGTTYSLPPAVSMSLHGVFGLTHSSASCLLQVCLLGRRHTAPGVGHIPAVGEHLKP